MNVEHINPFINATKNVIETMAFTKLDMGKLSLKTNNLSWGAVTGVMGLASETLSGNMLVSFDEASIIEIVNKMLYESFTQINKEVIDAVGEITNMITGGAKRELNEKGFFFDMAVPVVVTGQNIEITQMSKGPTIVVPFSTEKGQFVVEANLAQR